jgi:hypothetical protein
VRTLVSAAVVAAALTFVSASHAAAGRSNEPASLTIVTVPRLAGIHFSLDGRTFVTGPQGKARIQTTHGQHLLRILDTRLRAPGLRSTFVRWGDNEYSATRTLTIGHNTVLDAGFAQSVLVRFSFADGTGGPVVGRVTRLTLTNTLGSRVSFAPSWPQWLQASNVARRFTGLEPTLVQYSIEKALVSGSNVVNESQQRFYPAHTRHVTAHLLLYSARVSVHDFVFGSASGSHLDLVYPNGTRTSYPLRGGPLVLSSLPRGTYQVDVQADGYVPAVSLALSKNQVLSVKVVSYYDMLLFLVLVFGTVSGLILFPRPYLRLRLRSLGSGRRPTPDDLEPPKPLSGTRKQLIHRYMVDQAASPPARSAPSPAAARLPAPARATVAATDGERAERPLRGLPSRLLEAVRRLPQGFPDVRALPGRLRPAARSEASHDFLTGERIGLIHVYMGQEIAPRQEEAPPAAQEAAPNAAPTTSGPAAAPAPPTEEPVDARHRLLRAPQRAALAPLRLRMAGLSPRLLAVVTAARSTVRGRSGRAVTAMQKAAVRGRGAVRLFWQQVSLAARRFASLLRHAATGLRASTRRPRSGVAAQRSELGRPVTTIAAPQEATAAPASEPSVPVEANQESSGAVESPAPLAKEASTKPPTRRRAAATQKSAAPRPKAKPPVKETAKPKPPPKAKTKAKAKATTKAKAEATTKPKPKPRAKTKTSAQAAPRRAPRRTRTAATADEAVPVAREAADAASREDLELLRPDLAAAIKALEDDLREARAMTTKKGRSKGSEKVRR